jgi:predicted signal transduction protein with EAL and GGDEF domain
VKLNNAQRQVLFDILAADIEAGLYHGGDRTKSGATSKMAGAYARAGKDTAMQPALLADALDKFYAIKDGAKGAVQVSQAADEARLQMDSLLVMQNRRIIEQNDRMIVLLEQIAKKK